MYGAFWRVLTTFDRDYPEAQWRTVLGRVAADPQLSQAIAAAKEQRRSRIILYGQPRPRTPRITVSTSAGSDSTAAADPAAGVLVDCVDFSRTGQADAQTRQRKTVGLTRTPVRLTVHKRPTGWRVSAVEFPGGDC